MNAHAWFVQLPSLLSFVIVVNIHWEGSMMLHICRTRISRWISCGVIRPLDLRLRRLQGEVRTLFLSLCSPWQLPWPSDHIAAHLQGSKINVNLNCSESALWLLIYNIRKVHFPYLLAHRQPVIVPMAKWQSISPSAIQIHLTWCGPWWLLILCARRKDKKIGQGHSIFPASFETSGTNMCRIIVGRFRWRKPKLPWPRVRTFNTEE